MKKITKIILTISLILTCFISLKSSVKASWVGPSSLAPYVTPSDEMRAVWVATVGNLNFGKQINDTPDAIAKWKENYLKVLDDAQKYNLNTIVFQIRPANDAFYPSKYNPWSEYLVGYGVDPGWDPLQWMIEVTHERGLEYHAWLNPYRVSTSKNRSLMVEGRIGDIDVRELNEYKDSFFGDMAKNLNGIDNPICKTGEELHHDVVLGSEDMFILNPASDRVITHIQNTIKEIVDNYEIDGIHFDDYFYPNDANYGGTNLEYKGYTYSSEPWIDMADYKNYCNSLEESQTPLSIYDFRRENVNRLIKSLSDIIREKNTKKSRPCAFGISPAGRWAPTVEACKSEPHRGKEGGMSGSCYNYYSYSDLYADTYKWAIEEWVDYITPQNYTNLDGDYGEIIKWWDNALKNSKTKLYVGTALYLVKNGWGEGLSEIYYQVRYNNTFNKNIDGYFLFSYSSLESQIGASAMSNINRYSWKTDALTPIYPHYNYLEKTTEAPKISSISVEENVVKLKAERLENAKAYAICDITDGENKVILIETDPASLMTFTKEENKSYGLFAYNPDNTLSPHFLMIDLANNKPSVELQINDTYYTSETITGNIKITDIENSTYYIRGLFAHNGTDFDTEIFNEQITGTNYDFTYQLPQTSSSFASIKIEVVDGIHKLEEVKTFKILKTPPVVTLSNVKTVEVQEKQELTLEIKDDGDFTYDVYVAKDGGDFEIYYYGRNYKTQNKFEVSFYNPIKTCQIKVVVRDLETEATVLSDEFMVTSKIPNVEVSLSQKEYTLPSKLNLTIYIDDDSKNYSYKVYLGTTLLEEGNTTDDVITISKDLKEEFKGKIKVEVSDESTTFTKEIDLLVTKAKEKGCKCNSHMIMTFISLCALLVIIRKREN